MQRVFKNSGQLYKVGTDKYTEQTEVFYVSNHREFQKIENFAESSDGLVFGPWRVRPGGLSVSPAVVIFFIGVSDIWGY